MPKLWQLRSSIKLAACPTGLVSPGPCQAVRTLKSSPMAAIFLPGVKPPIWDMCIRRKSTSLSLIIGIISCGLFHSSPMAIGVAHCCLTMRK